MRLAVFAALSLPWLLACEGPKAEVSPVTVLWMDWPSEVNAGEPFRTRLVVWNVCAVNPQFRAGGHADQSTVTFEPYYLIGHDQIACLTQRTPTLLSLIALDTAGIAPGLAAASPRTYDMRAPVTDYALSTTAAPNSAVDKFGVVTVQPSGAAPLRRNAAGDVVAERDSLGRPSCSRIKPTRPASHTRSCADLSTRQRRRFAGRRACSSSSRATRAGSPAAPARPAPASSRAGSDRTSRSDS